MKININKRALVIDLIELLALALCWVFIAVSYKVLLHG